MLRLKTGHMIFIDPQDEVVSAHLIRDGFWEPNVTRVVRRLVRPGDSVIEVGANHGYFTMVMTRAAGDDGRVIALEANERLAALARRSVTFNGYGHRVRILAKAAADRPGSLAFITSRRLSGSGHALVPESALGEDQVVTTVEAVRLDDLLHPSAHFAGDEPGPDRVDFIRMDAEGSEPLILRGAERILANPDLIICMEWSVVQMRSRVCVPEFVAWLTAQGFRFWRIEMDAALTPLPSEAMAEIAHCEVVVSRRELTLNWIGPD